MRSRYLDVEDGTHDLADLLRDEPEVARDFSRKYELSWVYHENALEGLVFTQQEVETGIRMAPLLSEVGSAAALRAVRNFKTAIDIVRDEAAQKKPRITLALAKKLHETLLAGPDARSAGEFRKDIPIHRAYFHEIANPAQIPGELDKLFSWSETPEFRRAHPIHKASRLQHTFMQIFPYTDGSGKIARLLSNLVLINAGFLPCVIHTIDRQRYYDSLRLPEATLRELMTESMANGLANAEELIRKELETRAKGASRKRSA